MSGSPRVSGSPAQRIRPWIGTSASAMAWAVFVIVILHIVSTRDPLADTLSRYAFTRRGSGMLEAGVLGLAIGSLAVLGALIAANLRVRGAPTVLLTLWAAGLSMAAVFPASVEAHPAPVSGPIHQWSSVVALLCLPGFGFAVADRMGEIPGLTHFRTRVLALSWIAAVTLSVFGLSYVLDDLTGNALFEVLSTTLPVGLTQRVALAADLALLCGLLAVASRAVRTSSAAEGSPHLTAGGEETWAATVRSNER